MQYVIQFAIIFGSIIILTQETRAWWHLSLILYLNIKLQLRGVLHFMSNLIKCFNLIKEDELILTKYQERLLFSQIFFCDHRCTTAVCDKVCDIICDIICDTVCDVICSSVCDTICDRICSQITCDTFCGMIFGPESVYDK